jgi:NAD-dependent dihydropyrimidine dehydrogenase PreA subunit
MRADATFIGVEVDDAVVADRALAARLTAVCPVDVFAEHAGRVALRDENIDECILCGLCEEAASGAVRVHRLYDPVTGT